MNTIIFKLMLHSFVAGVLFVVQLDYVKQGSSGWAFTFNTIFLLISLSLAISYGAQISEKMNNVPKSEAS